MDGVLIVHKEAGMTSHDVVMKLRRILKTKKIGHSGTLDPNATGVLVVLVGKACKILPFIEDIDKEYIAGMCLGMRTLSDDIWDEVLERREIVPIHNFNDILQSFVGKIKQLPPLISSIKVNGKKLYEYARNNEYVERPLRDVEIYRIDMLDEEKLQFKVHCSSGTYIRSLCIDVAEKSGNLGCMNSLIRSKVGRFSLEDAKTLSQIEEGDYTLHSIASMLSHLPQIEYEKIEDVYNGKKIILKNQISNRVVICKNQECIAIYERLDRDVYKSVRGLW